MESIDVLPTVADILGVDVPWTMDGVSATGPVRADFTRRISSFGEIAPDGAVLPARDGRTDGYAPANFDAVLRARATTGSGGPDVRPYAIGPYASLLGRRIDGLTRTTPTPVEIDIVNHAAFARVDTGAPTAPHAYIHGLVDGPAPPEIIAFVVNGTVAGFAKAELLIGDSRPSLWASLAPQFFRDGANRIEAFTISGPVDTPTLARVTLSGLR
jgi:hypothetical protein